MDKEEVVYKIHSYLDLPENWDSYGGIVPTLENVEFVEKVVDKFPDNLYFCCPGPNGEIEVDWRVGNLEIEVFFMEGDNHILVYDKLEGLYLYDGKFDESVLKKFLDDLS